MTEDEAKTKACFEAATFGASQQLADGPGPHCIGAACMAWRWTEGKRTDAFLERVRQHMQAAGAKANFATSTQAVYAEEGKQYEYTDGFCGLAGASR